RGGSLGVADPQSQPGSARWSGFHCHHWIASSSRSGPRRREEGICTIFHTSGYDTQTIVNNNGGTDYGLFQISNKFWCKDDQNLQSRNICDISCDKFLDDDLTDDMICAKKILDKEGIDYWLAHKPLCSEKLEQWRCEKL
uniref:Lactose synthase B protein n=1 Tax=Canis lupus familiaris TaxID=9615 RepID=A0A8C0TSI4_CANLF